MYKKNIAKVYILCFIKISDFVWFRLQCIVVLLLNWTGLLLMKYLPDIPKIFENDGFKLGIVKRDNNPTNSRVGSKFLILLPTNQST